MLFRGLRRLLHVPDSTSPRSIVLLCRHLSKHNLVVLNLRVHSGQLLLQLTKALVVLLLRCLLFELLEHI